ncbi:MAG TPA: M23 family metallopeptidase [Chloroflexia bacterium]|nr:M23 family metallopeptidase [Chloroflexia bacterium]
MWRALLLCATVLLLLPAGPAPVAARAADPGPRLQGGFAAFWRAHNGALLFGEPLTDEIVTPRLTVQYLERARLEWHPDYPPGRQITLGRLGAELTWGRSFPPIAAFPSNPGHRYFAATGHSIQGELLRFWTAQGGVPIFGYPLSEELTEDGLTVQYFERARLEYHSELAAAGYPVLPTPLGALVQPGDAAAVVLEPPALSAGHTMAISVLAPPGATVVGATFGGQPLAMACCRTLSVVGRARTLPWALGGVEPDGVTGPVPLRITVRAADGAQQQITRSVPIRPYPYPIERTIYNGPRPPPSARDTERAILTPIFAQRNGGPRWAGKFAPPLQGALRVTSPFGAGRAYNDEPPYVVHGGVDFAADAGTPIYAPAPGRVVLVQAMEFRGNAVVLDHGAGVFTLYAHLSAFRVQVGQEVATGDVLGLVGSTGNATGPHLHWEVHVAGTYVEPQEWLARTFP